MATPFVRVDFSSSSRDFEPMTLEMGLPLLDERNARYQMLRQWLGPQVAEPDRKENQVGFYLRSPAGARLEKVECLPVTEDDLQGGLKKEFETLVANITRAEAKTADEQKVLRVVRAELESFTSDAQKRIRCCYLFKYRDHNRQPRLVWCPGYHRKDANPAGPSICTNPNCLHLFVRREGSHRCPSCQGRPAGKPEGPDRPKARRGLRVIAALLLVGLLAAGAWYTFHEDGEGGNPVGDSKPPLPENGTTLSVQPGKLDLAVGEIADLTIEAPASDAPIRIGSSMPEIVEVRDGKHLFGRAPGSCEINVSQGVHVVNVPVSVKIEPFQSLEFVPAEVSVGVGDSADFRVVGKTDKRQDVVISPELLDWVRRPDPDFAEFDDTQLRVRGVKSTGDDTIVLLVRFAGNNAHGRLKVVRPNLQLKLTADGSTELPEGQSLNLKVTATYGSGAIEELPAERVEFVAVEVEGLRLRDGAVQADKARAGPLRIIARFEGVDSNELDVSSVEAPPRKITLTVVPDRLPVGERGKATITASSPTGPVELSRDGMTFESSDPEIVAVDRDTGNFQAIKAGEAEIKGSHPAAKEPSLAKLTVDDAPVSLAPPKSVHLLIPGRETQSVKLPIGSAYSELRVEAEEANGSRRDVTAEAALRIAGDPSTLAIGLQDGRITAVRAGRAALKAEFAGVESAESIEFEVTENPGIDKIVVSPAAVTLAVGETPRLTAVAYKDGQIAGDVTDLKDLKWRIKGGASSAVFPGEGPVFAREAACPGTVEITAELGEIVSNPVSVTVVENSDLIPNKLVVTPESLQLAVGESRHLSSQAVKVLRGNQDITDDVQVSSASPDIVMFNAELRDLVGVGPGRTRLTLSTGGQLATLDVEVVPDQPVPKDAVLELEPSRRTLHVGERLTLRGVETCVECQRRRIDRTASLALASSAPDIVGVDGVTLFGVKPGKSTITGRLPGSTKPVIAEFTVVDADFSRLVVVPTSLKLNEGRRKKYTVYAIGPNGRTMIGSHPDLHVDVEGASPQSIEIIPPTREVVGVAEGSADLVFRWRDLEPCRLNVIVIASKPVVAIRIVPDAATVPAGEGTDFEVFGRRGGEWEPLSVEDGVSLSVAKRNVAEASGGLRVTGVGPGTTQVVASHGNRRATSTLKVTPGRGLPPGAPAGQPVALRFIPDLARFQLETQGDRIRVVAVYADGRQEDVDHRAVVTVRDPQDVIRIDKTGAGPVIHPEKLGQTQLDAELLGVRTSRPMLVEVVDMPPQQANLRIEPNPLRLTAGESRTIARGVISPGGGGRPFEVPVNITVSKTPIIRVERKNTVHGLKDGSATATARVADTASKYPDLSTSLRVEVGASAGDAGGNGSVAKDNWNDSASVPPRLVISGPDETTEGAEVALKVERLNGPGLGVDVTSQAQLSMPSENHARAELRPGCRVYAKRAGTVQVQARHEGLVSNPFEIRIGALDREFSRLSRLELSLNPAGLVTGEKRPYTLWGHPRGGGPRQDLTALVSDDPTVARRLRVQISVDEPNDDAVVFKHQPGELVAVAAGRARIQATYGDKLNSNSVKLQVAPAPNQSLAIRIDPDRVTVLEGEKSPLKFRVLVQSAGDRAFREINDAQLESTPHAVLEPLSDHPGQFKPVRPGKAKVVAKFGGLEKTAEVTVAANWFTQVDSSTGTDRIENFTIVATVTGNKTDEQLEYRLLADLNLNVKPKWTPADSIANDANHVSVQLTSPSIKRVNDKKSYQVYIEAHDKKDPNKIEVYPYSFRFKPQGDPGIVPIKGGPGNKGADRGPRAGDRVATGNRDPDDDSSADSADDFADLPDDDDEVAPAAATAGETESEGGGSEGSVFFGIKAKGSRVIYIVDCSGSMAGPRFQKACMELCDSIDRLTPRQKFFVFFFNDRAYPMLGGQRNGRDDGQAPSLRLVKATKSNVQKVKQWINEFHGDGGTDPREALLVSLGLRPDAIYLLTDGAFAEPIVDEVRQNNKRKIVINTIGFMDKEGESLLKLLAQQNRGEYRFVP